MFGSKCRHVLANGARCPLNALHGTNLCIDHTRNAGIQSSHLADDGIALPATQVAVLDTMNCPQRARVNYIEQVKALKHDRRFALDGKGHAKARVCIAPECCVEPVGTKPHLNDPEDAWLMWSTGEGIWRPYERRDFMNMKFNEYFRNPPPVRLHRRPSPRTHSDRMPRLDTRCTVCDTSHDTHP